MDFLKSLEGIMNSTTVSNLASGLVKSKAPAPVPAAPQAPVVISGPQAPAGMSQGMMLAIGGGLLAVVALIFVMRK